MTYIELMGDAERIPALNRVCGLHDEAMVDEKLAALFVGKSVQTLRRWRAHGVGPTPWKGPAHLTSDMTRTEGTNHSVQYQMKRLRTFIDEGFVEGTAEGLNRNEATIQKKLMLGFGSLQDLRDEQPWFQHIVSDGSSVMIGHALAMEPEKFEALWNDPDVELAWLPLDEAIEKPWYILESRTPFHEAYVAVLMSRLNATKERQATAEMFAATSLEGKRSDLEEAELFARFDALSRTF